MTDQWSGQVCNIRIIPVDESGQYRYQFTALVKSDCAEWWHRIAFNIVQSDALQKIGSQEALDRFLYPMLETYGEEALSK